METILGISSVAVALAALLFSVFSFSNQQSRVEHHQRASVRPLLSIKSQNYLDQKSVRVVNYGLGPAIVTNASFSRNGQLETNRLVDLFEKVPIRIWQHFATLPPGRAIPAGAEIVLVEQSLKHLQRNHGLPETEALAILERWREAKTGIDVCIEYEDVLGNKLEPLHDQLR